MASLGQGRLYYSFVNPETGRDEPTFCYLEGLERYRAPAAIGAGVFPREIPSACRSGDVNAASLEAESAPGGCRSLCVSPPWNWNRRGTSSLSRC